MNRISFDSPLGWLTVTETQGAITEVAWGQAAEGEETKQLAAARQQIMEYFDGARRSFDLPLAPAGSDFQRAVCAAISEIPFGETRTYGEIADALGASAQAVGNACGANPIPVVIPCHRVLGASSLGGYSGAGGIETKVDLLRHEGAAGLLI